MRIRIPKKPVFTNHDTKPGVFVLQKLWQCIVDGNRWIVPDGFEFEITRPRIWAGSLPDSGAYTEAFLIHDWLYSIKQTSRKYADSVMLAVMKYRGVYKWQYRRIYWAIRAFGWLPWRK